MRDPATSFASLLGNQIGLVRRSCTSRDEGSSKTPVPSGFVHLSDAPANCPMYLLANETSGLLKQRLTDLGFIAGTPLRLVRRGPKGNLIAVRIRDTVIALRSEEARSLWVTPVVTPPRVSDA